jgi:hypothetical protein
MTTATTVVRSTEVTALIMEAGVAAASMLTACKDAGVLIAAQVNPMGLSLKEAVELGMNAYAEDFTKAGHNIRANVKDALTLALAADAPVTYTHKGVEKHTTAKDAIQLPKHEFKEAVKAVREDNDMARAAGGGRTPKTPVGPDKKPSAVQTTENNTDLAFAAFIHNLPVYFKDADKALQITAVLKEMGLKLQQIK